MGTAAAVTAALVMAIDCTQNHGCVLPVAGPLGQLPLAEAHSKLCCCEQRRAFGSFTLDSAAGLDLHERGKVVQTQPAQLARVAPAKRRRLGTLERLGG